MKKIVAILLSLMLCSIAFGAMAENADDPIVVGLIQQNLTHPFHLGEVEGAKTAAATYGFELLVGSGDDNVAHQVEVFEQFLDKCDIISINTLDVTAFANAFEEAKEKGVKVVVQHSWSEPGMSEGTIGFDEWAMSGEVGEYAIELLKAQGGELTEKNVVMLTGNLGQGLNEGRTGGFAEVMDDNGVTILAQEATNWDGTQAVTIMENYLTTYGDQINLLYGLSDGVTYPAAQVIINDGRADQILICSIDGASDAIQAIIDGDMDCTYMLASQYTGYYKVLIPYKVMTGEYDFAAQGDYILPGIIVTEDNAAAMLQMADDMENSIDTFPFDESLTDIINSYLSE